MQDLGYRSNAIRSPYWQMQMTAQDSVLFEGVYAYHDKIRTPNTIEKSIVFGNSLSFREDQGTIILSLLAHIQPETKMLFTFGKIVAKTLISSDNGVG